MSESSGSYDPNNWQVRRGRDHYWIEGGRSGVICETVAARPDDLVNAHLLSDAPDLLEVLEGVLQRIKATGGYVGQDGQYAKTIQAAIAKAKGETA